MQTPEPAMDAVLVAIAELKQVKDILHGLLADDAPAHLPPANPAPSPASPPPAAAPISAPTPVPAAASVSAPQLSTSPPPGDRK